MSLDAGILINSESAFSASPAKKPNTRSSHAATNVPMTPSGPASSESFVSEAYTTTSSVSPEENQVISTSSGPPSGDGPSETNSVPPRSTSDSDYILQQMFARFDGIESKLGKLDGMERQLAKLDGIEAKTDGLVKDMHSVKGSLNSLQDEVETVKAEAKRSEERLEKEVADLRAQLKSQDAKLASMAEGIEDRVLTETRSHFNGFTRHIEHAFVREQAASRKYNLIFTGVQENNRVPDVAKIRNICSSSLKINNLSIQTADRLGAKARSSARPRPILVRFNTLPDRNRVWRAKKKLQQGPERNIWVQEDMPRSLREDLRALLKVAKHAESLGKEEYKFIRVQDFRLTLNNKSYGPSELEQLPHDLRPSTICTKWTDNVVIFFGRYSPLSNHHISPFTVNETSFSCVEQYLAVARARLSGNTEMLERALSCSNPSDCRGILNALREDHRDEWENCRAPVLMKALRNKFTQNAALGNYLKETFPRHLGEASSDVAWGIGLDLEDENATSTSSWHAEGNLLGKSLSTVRNELMSDTGFP